MSNVRENELKNARDDLKNSIENLKDELEQIKLIIGRYNGWGNPEAMHRDMLEWEIERRGRELAILDYLIAVYETTEIRVGVSDEYSGDARSYWEIAECFRKHPSMNAATTGADWMNDL